MSVNVRTNSLKCPLDEKLIEQLESYLRRFIITEEGVQLTNNQSDIKEAYVRVLALVQQAEWWLSTCPAVRRAAIAQLEAFQKEQANQPSEEYGDSLRHLLESNYRVLSVEDLLYERAHSFEVAAEHVAALAATSNNTTLAHISSTVLRNALRDHKWDVNEMVATLRQALEDNNLTSVLERYGFQPDHATDTNNLGESRAQLTKSKEITKAAERWASVFERDDIECPGNFRLLYLSFLIILKSLTPMHRLS